MSGRKNNTIFRQNEQKVLPPITKSIRHVQLFYLFILIGLFIKSVHYRVGPIKGHELEIVVLLPFNMFDLTMSLIVHILAPSAVLVWDATSNRVKHSK